jgi:hypothetical protein
MGRFNSIPHKLPNPLGFLRSQLNHIDSMHPKPSVSHNLYTGLIYTCLWLPYFKTPAMIPSNPEVYPHILQIQELGSCFLETQNISHSPSTKILELWIKIFKLTQALCSSPFQ